MEQRRSKEMPLPDARSTRGTRRTALRVMHRKSVGMMAVYEQDPTVAESGARTLVFECPNENKRTSEFPNEWYRLTDDELAALRRAAS